MSTGNSDDGNQPKWHGHANPAPAGFGRKWSDQYGEAQIEGERFQMLTNETSNYYFAFFSYGNSVASFRAIIQFQ